MIHVLVTSMRVPSQTLLRRLSDIVAAAAVPKRTVVTLAVREPLPHTRTVLLPPQIAISVHAGAQCASALRCAAAEARLMSPKKHRRAGLVVLLSPGAAAVTRGWDQYLRDAFRIQGSDGRDTTAFTAALNPPTAVTASKATATAAAAKPPPATFAVPTIRRPGEIPAFQWREQDAAEGVRNRRARGLSFDFMCMSVACLRSVGLPDMAAVRQRDAEVLFFALMSSRGIRLRHPARVPFARHGGRMDKDLRASPGPKLTEQLRLSHDHIQTMFQQPVVRQRLLQALRLAAAAAVAAPNPAAEAAEAARDDPFAHTPLESTHAWLRRIEHG